MILRETAHAREITELIDPAVVADTFVEGVGEIEKVGTSCVRVTLYATRSIGRGERERIVVARLVLPEAGFARSLRQCAAFAAGEQTIDEDAQPDGAKH
jgi:hypothetical protein